MCFGHYVRCVVIGWRSCGLGRSSMVACCLKSMVGYWIESAGRNE